MNSNGFGGGVPNLGQPSEEARKAAIASQITKMGSEIFTAAVAARLSHSGPPPEPGAFENLARYSHFAAQDYFTGLGIISVEGEK